MKLIHIIHRLKKLFTLKHSCFQVNFTLKRSCLYAETLLRSIYTYIYLYKKSCSWGQQIVNNFLFKKLNTFLIAIVAAALMTGCYKQTPSEIAQDAAFNLSTPPHRTFKQIPGNTYQPSAYFTCGKNADPCPQPSQLGKQIHSSKMKKHKRDNFLNLKGE